MEEDYKNVADSWLTCMLVLEVSGCAERRQLMPKRKVGPVYIGKWSSLAALAAALVRVRPFTMGPSRTHLVRFLPWTGGPPAPLKTTYTLHYNRFPFPTSKQPTNNTKANVALREILQVKFFMADEKGKRTGRPTCVVCTDSTQIA